jgi:hypothetical protein
MSDNNKLPKLTPPQHIKTVAAAAATRAPQVIFLFLFFILLN